MGEATNAAVRAVVAEWQAISDLCCIAAAGKMAKVSDSKDLDRKEVCVNASVLAPIIKHMGSLSDQLVPFDGILSSACM